MRESMLLDPWTRVDRVREGLSVYSVVYCYVCVRCAGPGLFYRNGSSHATSITSHSRALRASSSAEVSKARPNSRHLGASARRVVS